MIIKDGDFYSALTHLKNSMANLEDGNIEVAKVQIEAVDICLKSAITDLLDENGEIKIFCENPLLQWSKEDVERVAESNGIEITEDAMEILEEAVEEKADAIGELINTSILYILKNQE